MKNNLLRSPISAINFAAPLTEDIPRITVMGLQGFGDSVVGIAIEETVLNRIPHDPVKNKAQETIDQLMIRAAKELVPNFSRNAPRNSFGHPIGYLIYEGLPADHCRPK